MNYELRHYNTSLIKFSATEDTNFPEIEIFWINEEKRGLFPLDLTLSGEGIFKWIRNRLIPKNRAYAHNFLSKRSPHTRTPRGPS